MSSPYTLADVGEGARFGKEKKIKNNVYVVSSTSRALIYWPKRKRYKPTMN
jgi:hypothetical protein